jgi:hypothetical protein
MPNGANSIHKQLRTELEDYIKCKRSIIDRLFNGAKKSDNNSTGT